MVRKNGPARRRHGAKFSPSTSTPAISHGVRRSAPSTNWTRSACPRLERPSTAADRSRPQGGLVFIGATIDQRFRAIDAKTGKELWTTKLVDAAKALPITYQGKDGKQYVAILAAGGEARGADNPGGRLYVFALPSEKGK